METPKGPYKDYSPFKRGAIWVSMLVCGSVYIYIDRAPYSPLGAQQISEV